MPGRAGCSNSFHEMRIINLVDRLDRVNFGIWNAAIATASELELRHGIASEVWFPQSTHEAKEEELRGVLARPLQRLDPEGLQATSQAAGLDPSRDLIVSHGCWQYPTRWARILANQGFVWVAVPHGMLEPWSVSQKRLRKWVYFHLLEKPALRRAQAIRAVGQPEMKRLRQRFGNTTCWIPNGVASRKDASKPKPEGKTFLFMARLHHKKGVLPLVQGWAGSSLANRDGYVLKLAGPDDGALQPLQTWLKDHAGIRNITYLGPVYGADKEILLQESHFYVLPSFSEGFPTSVLEAMQFGLVPLISDGCNFPDAFSEGHAIRVEPDPDHVRQGLEAAAGLDEEAYARRSARSRTFIETHYTHSRLADQQAELYRRLLSPSVSARTGMAKAL